GRRGSFAAKQWDRGWGGGQLKCSEDRKPCPEAQPTPGLQSCVVCPQPALLGKGLRTFLFLAEEIADCLRQPFPLRVIAQSVAEPSFHDTSDIGKESGIRCRARNAERQAGSGALGCSCKSSDRAANHA